MGAEASFAEKMLGIAKILEGGKYEECFRKNAELIQFANVLHNEDWILLCEVLESVCLNMAELVSTHKIPEDVEAGISKKLGKGLEDAVRAYEGGDELSKYRAIRSVRDNATTFQFSALTTYPERQGGEMSTLALRRHRRKHMRGGNYSDAETAMPNQANSGQTTKNPVGGRSKNIRDESLIEKYKSAKLEYVAGYYALKTRRTQSRSANTVKSVPKVLHGRDKASNVVGLGVLCVIGTVAAIQTGPFPLNFAVGAGIMLLFARESMKRRCMRCASASSKA